jgi:hypothetical protein
MGNKIVVAAEPQGRFVDGIVSGALYPGMAVEIYSGVEPINGRFTYRVCTPGTNGYPSAVAVLCEDELQGVAATVAYTTGYYCRVYYPLFGEEINCLVKNIAGTGDTHAIGDLFMIENASGLLIASTAAAVGTRAPYKLIETSAALTADKLLCMIRI